MNKGLLAAVSAVVLMTATAYAQMDGSQGDGMMGGNSGWGRGYYGWGSMIIIVILIVLVVAYMMKRK